MLSIIKVVGCLFLCFLALAAAATKQQRDSAHIEEKVRKLDHATKQQVLMMQHSNIPKDVIAKKISQAVGGSTATAHRVIDGINREKNSEKLDKEARIKRMQAKPKNRR